LPWQKLIEKYNRPETFFYCDPPYHLCPDYKHNLVLEDFQEMAKILKSTQGKFMLSINDHPEIREVFRTFNLKKVTLLYTVGKDHPAETVELIYSNFDFKEIKDLNLFSYQN